MGLGQSTPSRKFKMFRNASSQTPGWERVGKSLWAPPPKNSTRAGGRALPLANKTRFILQVDSGGLSKTIVFPPECQTSRKGCKSLVILFCTSGMKNLLSLSQSGGHIIISCRCLNFWKLSSHFTFPSRSPERQDTSNVFLKAWHTPQYQL